MRLIDATKVERKVEQFLQYRYEDYGTMFGPGLEILNIIRNAPTIAPPPNTPLTLEELREMDGEPVFIKNPEYWDCWALVRVRDKIMLTLNNGAMFPAELEFKCGGEAYRRKPEEETP